MTSIWRPTILIVDQDREYAKLCEQWFGKLCQVRLAQTCLEAMTVLEEDQVDVVLMGIKSKFIKFYIGIARELKEKKVGLVVCLMTDKLCDVYNLNEKMFCIEKTSVEKLMVAPVLNQWRIKQEGLDFWIKKMIQLELPHKNCISEVCRKVIEGAEAVDFRLRRDASSASYIRSVCYRHDNHRDRFNSGVSVMRGCYGKCRMCETGKIIQGITKLNSSEMVAQVLHSLDSHLANRCLENQISVGFTCGGDFIFNPDEVCKAIITLAETFKKKINFVIPTISNEKVLIKFLPLIEDYPVQIFWSCHSLKKEKRDWLLPLTKNQSPERTKEILSNFSKKVGRKFPECKKWTLSWMLVKGFNDSIFDIHDIAEFCDDDCPVDVKVMICDGGLPEYPGVITQQEAQNFVGKLKSLGIDARFAANMGSDSKTPTYMTCGKTRPVYDVVS